MKQLSFFKNKISLQFGGSLKGRRKNARPLDFRKPHHYVLKAVDSFQLLKKRSEVERTIQHFNKRFGVRMYSMAVHCDHIHLNVRLHNRILYRRWIRGLTSALVLRIPGLKFGLRPFSKIISWGRQFERLNNYIASNRHEAELIVFAHQKLEWCLEQSHSFIRVMHPPRFPAKD